MREILKALKERLLNIIKGKKKNQPDALNIKVDKSAMIDITVVIIHITK